MDHFEIRRTPWMRFILMALPCLLLAMLVYFSLHAGPELPEEVPPEVFTDPIVDPIADEEQQDLRLEELPPVYILHAGGLCNGKDISNSLEAVMETLDAGLRFIELDFNFTADDVPICLHNWGTEYFAGYAEAELPLTAEQFRSAAIYGSMTPLFLSDIIDLLDAYPDLQIVTDAKDCQTEFLEYVAANYPEWQDRFYVQVYSPEDIAQAGELGFSHIIWTLYALRNVQKLDPEWIVSIAKDQPLWAITFPMEFVDIEGYVSTLKATGLPLFTHTVNDPQEIVHELAVGINGVYTDMRF